MENGREILTIAKNRLRRRHPSPTYYNPFSSYSFFSFPFGIENMIDFYVPFDICLLLIAPSPSASYDVLLLLLLFYVVPRLNVSAGNMKEREEYEERKAETSYSDVVNKRRNQFKYPTQNSINHFKQM